MVVISFFTTAIVVPATAVYFDWDPIYLALVAVLKLSGLDATFPSKSYIVGVRMALTAIVAQTMLLNFRTLTMIYCQIGVSVLESKKKWRTDEELLCVATFFEYRISQTSRAVTYDLSKYPVGGVLSIAFVVFVVGTNITWFGIRNLSSIFIPCLSGFFVVAELLFISLLFEVGCSIYETSGTVKAKWMRNLENCKRTQRPLLKRLLLSCPQISIPVGGVGIMDRDIKMNYFHNTVNYIVTPLLVVNDGL
ncbi:unnamed protein product [Orchesella dallaii]|uniref:Gustatory receptor n=1 Tax=Orchesella dallaii TaxID=48710 RepID=A0ABP1S0S5_9HEXA